MVEAAAGKRLAELLEIDAGEIRLDTGVDHLPRQCIGRALPERKHRRNTSATELLLAIAPHIFQKEIPKDHLRDAGSLRIRKRRRHARFIDFVRAWERDRYAHERQASRLELSNKNLLAHAMHAHSSKHLGD